MCDFIKIKDVIVAVSTIKNMIIHDQVLMIETSEGEIDVRFSSRREARNELDRIYQALKD